ncbi:MAG: dihydroorotate dehydrogenase [Bathelium mastoideum]|nr:MAG: dihydroorotate dehydrogenase [Bathelium mastoideum]
MVVPPIYTARPPLPRIEPALLNTACAWATTFEDLVELFDCPYTGAITTRTCTLEGFRDDPSIHQFVFFDPHNNKASECKNKSFFSTTGETGSLNTLGYSPVSLQDCLQIIQRLHSERGIRTSTHWSEEHLPNLPKLKPIIISVTGSPEDICRAWRMITYTRDKHPGDLCMEINLSCPNIPDAPPPAYDASALLDYLDKLNNAIAAYLDMSPRAQGRAHLMPIGIKCPPFTHLGQFENLITALLKSCRGSNGLSCPISFITTTNTLGSSLLGSADGVGNFDASLTSANSDGIGGLGGTPIHPLSLGNVRTLRRLLDGHPELRSIDIIGVGGVNDAAGVARMRAAGAKAVGLATALGREGVQVFEKICKPPPKAASTRISKI